jgi:hypothetical protein
VHRHEFDVLSLAGGLLAVGGAVLYQLDLARIADLDARWAASLALIVVGLAGIAAALRGRDPAE